MPGLKINVGGGSSIGGNTLGGGSRLGQSGPATVAQVAYGGGASPNTDSKFGYVHVHIGVTAAALAMAVFVRHSLPSGMKKTFDLVVIEMTLAVPIYASAGVWARKQLHFGPPEGIMHDVARITKGFTP
jgi:hypothetical protein